MILVLQAFMLIFSFRFGNFPLIDSSIVLGIFLMMKLFFSTQYRNTVYKILINKSIFKIFLFLGILIIYSGIVTVLHSQYDFSILKPLLHQGICLFICMLYFANCKVQYKHDNIICYIIYAFFIQSIIQCISFISLPVCNFLDFFRSPALLRVRENSGGIRGHALASMDFFALGAAYGLIYIFFVLQWKKIFFKTLPLKCFMLSFLVLGGIMAARTSLIGLAFSIFLLALHLLIEIKNNRLYFARKTTANSSVIFMSGVTLVFLYFGIFSNNMSQKIQTHISRFIYWAFELFVNFSRGKGIYTASTNVLFQEMYFPIHFQTIFFGDGLYTGADGAYYMGTDAGYMRNFLFFGIFGFILLLFYQMCFFNWKKQNMFINCILIIYMLVLHIKGDVLGFLIITQTLLMAYLMFTIYKQSTDTP